MLTVWGSKRGGGCQGGSRRDFLKIGACGLGGMTSPGLLHARQAKNPGRPLFRPTDLRATFFKFLGVPRDLQYTNLSGRPQAMLDSGQPIAGLW